MLDPGLESIEIEYLAEQVLRQDQELAGDAPAAEFGVDHSVMVAHAIRFQRKKHNETTTVTKPKELSLAEAAKRGIYERVVDRAVSADIPTIFERAITDFRTVRRNDGHRRILAWCLEAGLDPLTRVGWFDVPAVVLAAHFGNREFLILAEPLPDDPRVHAALADVELPWDFVDDNGFTLLMYCAMSRFAEVQTCERAIRRGVDPCHTVLNQLPIDAAFLCAACGGPVGIMRQLVASGGVHEGNYHQTIEHALEPHQRSGPPAGELARVVLDGGFDVNAIREDQGRTLLHGAANRGTIKAVEWLLANGADPNVEDSVGRTPLHVAAVRNTTTGVVSRLVAAGADRNCVDDDGMTASDYAVAKKRVKVASFLGDLA